MRADIRRCWAAEMQAARIAADRQERWHRLGRAHVLSQPVARLHIRTHAAMLNLAVRERRRHEIGGQLLRIVVAGPASLTGRYPRGNTGGADVPATQTLPIPDDLAAVLERAARRVAAD